MPPRIPSDRSYNAKGKTYSFNEKQVLDGLYESLVVSMTVAENEGTIEIGTLLSVNHNGEVVAYNDNLTKTIDDNDDNGDGYSKELDYPIQPGSVSVESSGDFYEDDGNGQIWNEDRVIGNVNYDKGIVFLSYDAGNSFEITYANKLVGVAYDKVDEAAGEVVIAVVKKGVVVLDELKKKNGEEITKSDLKHLENINIYTI